MSIQCQSPVEMLATEPRRFARHFYRRAEDIIITNSPNEIVALRIPLSRFADTAPDTLHHFITASPDFDPVRCLEVDVYAGAELVAASYFDVGATATSAVYCMWKPTWRRYELGKFTLLKEIAEKIRGQSHERTCSDGGGNRLRSSLAGSEFSTKRGPGIWVAFTADTVHHHTRLPDCPCVMIGSATCLLFITSMNLRIEVRR